MKTQHDGRGDGDRVLTTVLTHTASIEQHLTVGLRAMMEAGGVTPELCAAVQAFVEPSLRLLRDAEQAVVLYVQGRDEIVPLTHAVEEQSRGR